MDLAPTGALVRNPGWSISASMAALHLAHESTLRAEKARRNKEAALGAFNARKAEINTMLARLQALVDDQLCCSPDEFNWGHVGTLEHYASLLKRITDNAFGEGEHAE